MGYANGTLVCKCGRSRALFIEPNAVPTLPVQRAPFPTAVIGKAGLRFCHAKRRHTYWTIDVGPGTQTSPGMFLTVREKLLSSDEQHSKPCSHHIHTLTITTMAKMTLSAGQRENILRTLQDRFEKHMNRHKGLEWTKVQAKLNTAVEKLWSLHEMERTGGEPDLVGQDKKTREYVFYDCSAETPKGRRSLCYDRQALESRKANKPKNNAMDMAAAMGIELLTEEQYRELQQLGSFDLTTSSWVQTPAGIRKMGGALFCDRRFDTVFVHHNGAESYYAARGFRGLLKV